MTMRQSRRIPRLILLTFVPLNAIFVSACRPRPSDPPREREAVAAETSTPLPRATEERGVHARTTTRPAAAEATCKPADWMPAPLDPAQYSISGLAFVSANAQRVELLAVHDNKKSDQPRVGLIT